MNALLVEPAVAADVSVPIAKRPIPVWKRVLDLCGIAIATPLLSPLLIAVAIYIKLVSRGPVLFVQTRVGHGGDDFQIYKFRTMHVPEVSRDASHRTYVANQAGDSGPNKKPSYKSELIPGGDLIRKLSIDEFPQLINVLIGNMSLVGPRPDLLRLEDYKPHQLRRFEVAPGMTGLWQVSGKNRVTFEQMIKMDIEYLETVSLTRDLRIMAKTITVLIFERNE